MKHLYEVDENGFFVRDVHLSDVQEIPPNCVETFLPNGMFSPKYVDGAWVNGLTDDEIDLLMGRDLLTTKAKKDAELNKACQDAILAGFTHEINGVVYWFSYDYEAQGNFRDARDILKDNIVTEVPWTVRIGSVDGEYTRIPVTLEIMNELTLKIMEHKMSNIGKYRDFLMPIVNAEQDVDEVRKITWNYEEEVVEIG
jgi:hypothetical protein